MVSLHPRSITSPLFQSPVAPSPQPLCPHPIAELCTFLSSWHTTSFAKHFISTIFSGLQHLGTLSWLEAQWVSQTAVISPEMEHQRSNLFVVPKARLSLATLQNRTTYTAEVHPSCNSFHPNKIQSWEMTQLAWKIGGTMLELPYDLLRSSLMAGNDSSIISQTHL